MKRSSKFGRVIILISVIALALTFALMYLNTVRQQNSIYVEIDPDTMKLVQLDEPKEGDPIAIVETSVGEVRFVLYPQYSPNAVQNFTELAQSGYYDGTYIFNCDNGAYSAGGAKSTDGNVNNDDPHEKIKRELSQDLWPFRGAVCMMNTTVDRGVKEFIFGGGTYYCGSRFEFINTIDFTDEIKEEMRSASDIDELTDAFIKLGGVPNFSQQMTVIGQVYEGLDVVDALANADAHSNGVYNIPKEDIKIISVKTGTYAPEESAEKQ